MNKEDIELFIVYLLKSIVASDASLPLLFDGALIFHAIHLGISPATTKIVSSPSPILVNS